MKGILPHLVRGLKAANWLMALAIAALGGTLFFSSLACYSPMEPLVGLDERDSLAVLAILQANGKSWPKGYFAEGRDSSGHLTSLSLYNMGLDTLPPAIGDLIFLTHLNLSYNRLERLPREIEALTALTELDLRRNRIVSLPDGFTFAHLRWLDLSSNAISVLPRNVDVTGLEGLLLDSNRITELPPDFRYLGRLEALSLSGNLLDSLPADFGPENHPKLKRLNVAGNRLRTLPVSMKGFTLDYLDLANNRLCWTGNAEADSAMRTLEAWMDSTDRDWRLDQNCK
jgi:Leucine-rich repeat (LRR) protein